MLCLLAAADYLVAQAVTEPFVLESELRNSLSRNGGALSSLTINWVQQLRPAPGAGNVVDQLLIDLPPEVLFAPKVWTTIVQDPLIYSRIENRVRGQAPWVSEHSFDGTSFYAGNPAVAAPERAEPGDLVKYDIRRIARERPDTQWMKCDYLDYAGYSIPTTPKEFSENVGIRSRILTLLDAGSLISASGVQLAGVPATRIEIEAPDPLVERAKATDPVIVERNLREASVPEAEIRKDLATLDRQRNLPPNKRHVFYLDPQRGNAVTRYEERRPDGALLLQATNDSFRQLPQRKVWLPEQTHITFFTWPAAADKIFDHPMLIQDLRVVSFDPEPKPVSVFTLNYNTPGTRVVETPSTGPQVSYEIPASPSELDEAVGRARDSGILGSTGRFTTRWSLFALLGAALIVVALLLVWLARHYKGRAG